MKLRLFVFYFILILSTTAWANLMILEEGFEDGIPTDWTQEYVSGSIDWTVNYGGYNGNPMEPHSGNNNAFFFDESTEGYSTRLITPAFDLNPESITVLSFWYTTDDWVGYQDELRVYYRIGDGEWQLLGEYIDDEVEWQQVSYTLPEAGDDMQFCFEGTAAWGYGICLDDVIIMDDVLRILVWDHDNGSSYTDLDNGGLSNCEDGITNQLDALGIEYNVSSSLGENLSANYDIVFVELGLYCVG